MGIGEHSPHSRDELGERAENSQVDGDSVERGSRRWRGADAGKVALLGMTAVLVYAAVRTYWAFATAIVLGAWAVHIARPLFRWLERKLHGRERAAALLTGALLIIVATPVAFTVATLVPAARALVDQLRETQGARSALELLVSAGSSGGKPGDITQVIREHGAGASKVAATIATASIEAIIGVFIFLVVFFSGLVNGRRLWRWLEKNAPIDPSAMQRMSDAFFQAGRGLIIGNGITALVQGGLATITYLVLGVPRAVLLGFLSVVASLIPVTGPTIVWIPVAVGLALTGHAAKAVILVCVGVFVIGTIDNLLRPYLAKRAHVGLDTATVLVAIFGGIALFGGWGLLLGPLIVRLAAEALSLVRERGLLGRST